MNVGRHIFARLTVPVCEDSFLFTSFISLSHVLWFSMHKAYKFVKCSSTYFTHLMLL